MFVMVGRWIKAGGFAGKIGVPQPPQSF
jgi:hypothetical protein